MRSRGAEGLLAGEGDLGATPPVKGDLRLWQ